LSGLDAARLERIRTHFGRYVEDGRLPGYLKPINSLLKGYLPVTPSAQHLPAIYRPQKMNAIFIWTIR